MPLRDVVPSLGPHTAMAFFDQDSAALSARAREMIAEDRRIFLEGNFRTLEAVGYADMAEHDPIGLSLRRALAVRDELIRLGIDADTIEVRGAGTHMPIAPNVEGRPEPQNRRADVEIGD